MTIWHCMTIKGYVIMKRTLIFLLITVSLTSVIAQSQGPFTEIKLYTNLYSQTANFDVGSTKFTDTVRRSFVTNILEINLHQPQKRIWWGLDAYFRASRQDPIDESPFKVLSYQSNGQNAQTSLSHIGPKLNWRPNPDNDNLYIKLIMLVPVGGSNTTSTSTLPALDNSGFQFWSQVNYNAKLAEKLYGYGELSIVGRFGRDGEPSSDIFIPIKTFLSYFPAEAIGVFGFLDFTPTITTPNAFYFQPGGGIKIFPSKQWQIELSASSFVAGKNSGAGYSFNLGLSYKIVKNKS